MAADEPAAHQRAPLRRLHDGGDGGPDGGRLRPLHLSEARPTAGHPVRGRCATNVARMAVLPGTHCR